MDWLEDLAVTIHTRMARIFGEAFWDIHAPNSTASAALSEVASLRRRYRIRGVGFLAALAWKTAGGLGDPPQKLVLAFALNLSAFSTQALMVDFDQTATQVGVLTAGILQAFVKECLDGQVDARQ